MSLKSAALLLPVLLTSCVAAQPLFTREKFDDMDRRLDAMRNIPEATADEFAWGEGYMMRAYVEMYLATKDADYLRRLVRAADPIIDTRDDRVAAREGRTGPPLWSLGGKYTQARLVLKDAQGRDAIMLRSIRYAYNDQTRVKLTPGEGGTFSLTTSNDFWQEHLAADVAFENLSLDPASPRYFERIINDPQYAPQADFDRDPEISASTLLLALDLRPDRTEASQLAAVEDAALVPGIVQYYGYIGPIFAPMTRFASLVLKSPELHEEFKPAAERFLTAAAESIAAYESCWREGPGADEGHYLLIDRGAEFWCDGIMAPWNYMGATGQVIANLYDWTGDARYLDKLARMATLFKRDLTLTDRGGYSWPYWSQVGYTGWKREQDLSVNTPEYGATTSADDLSHAALEVEFAVMCWERGIVFSEEDMKRFALTFTRQLWQPETKSLLRRVDGSGGTTETGDAIAGARWLELAVVEPEVYRINEELWRGFGEKFGFYGHAVGNYARMYRWQEWMKAREQ